MSIVILKVNLSGVYGAYMNSFQVSCQVQQRYTYDSYYQRVYQVSMRHVQCHCVRSLQDLYVCSVYISVWIFIYITPCTGLSIQPKVQRIGSTCTPPDPSSEATSIQATSERVVAHPTNN